MINSVEGKGRFILGCPRVRKPETLIPMNELSCHIRMMSKTNVELPTEERRMNEGILVVQKFEFQLDHKANENTHHHQVIPSLINPIIRKFYFL